MFYGARKTLTDFCQKNNIPKDEFLFLMTRVGPRYETVVDKTTYPLREVGKENTYKPLVCTSARSWKNRFRSIHDRAVYSGKAVAGHGTAQVIADQHYDTIVVDMTINEFNENKTIKEEWSAEICRIKKAFARLRFYPLELDIIDTIKDAKLKYVKDVDCSVAGIGKKSRLTFVPRVYKKTGVLNIKSKVYSGGEMASYEYAANDMNKNYRQKIVQHAYLELMKKLEAADENFIAAAKVIGATKNK